MRGKATRKRMKGRVKHAAAAVLDKWVVDTMGPMRMEDREGHRYVLVVMDVCSHYVMMVLMKRKSEAALQLKIMIAREQTQKEKLLKILHSAGGQKL